MPVPKHVKLVIEADQDLVCIRNRYGLLIPFASEVVGYHSFVGSLEPVSNYMIARVERVGSALE